MNKCEYLIFANSWQWFLDFLNHAQPFLWRFFSLFCIWDFLCCMNNERNCKTIEPNRLHQHFMMVFALQFFLNSLSSLQHSQFNFHISEICKLNIGWRYIAVFQCLHVRVALFMRSRCVPIDGDNRDFVTPSTFLNKTCRWRRIVLFSFFTLCRNWMRRDSKLIYANWSCKYVQFILHK